MPRSASLRRSDSSLGGPGFRRALSLAPAPGWGGLGGVAESLEQSQVDPNAHLVCVADWLRRRTLRSFLLRFTEQSWGEVTRNLCSLGVLCLQHLSPNLGAWGVEELDGLVNHIERCEKWPEELTPGTPEHSEELWTPPWKCPFVAFRKPSPQWRSAKASAPKGAAMLRSVVTRKTLPVCKSSVTASRSAPDRWPGLLPSAVDRSWPRAQDIKSCAIRRNGHLRAHSGQRRADLNALPPRDLLNKDLGGGRRAAPPGRPQGEPDRPGVEEWLEVEGRLRRAVESGPKSAPPRSVTSASLRRCQEFSAARIARGGWAAEVPRGGELCRGTSASMSATTSSGLSDLDPSKMSTLPGVDAEARGHSRACGAGPLPVCGVAAPCLGRLPPQG